MSTVNDPLAGGSRDASESTAVNPYCGDGIGTLTLAIAARALREAADEYGTPGMTATTSYVQGWLRDRADEIEAAR